MKKLILSMKKNLKNYSQFLKENDQFGYQTVEEYLSGPRGIVDGNFFSIFQGKNFDEIIKNHTEWLNQLRKDFAESIKSSTYGSSFSDLCKRKNDPEDDFREIEKKLRDDAGWDFESIKNLFSDIVNTRTGQQFEEFINKFRLDSENGYVDVYLYKLADKLGLDSNIVRLGGGGWSDYVKEDVDEIVIRYRYGYHHTKYGQLMLEQIGWSKQVFVIQALEALQSTIFNDLAYRQNSKNIINTLRQLNMKDFSIVDDDRLIIYIEEIRKKLLDENINFTREDLVSELVACVDDYGLDVIDTGSELIFSEKN